MTLRCDIYTFDIKQPKFCIFSLYFQSQVKFIVKLKQKTSKRIKYILLLSTKSGLFELLF